jgi:leucyl aminopeptidase
VVEGSLLAGYRYQGFKSGSDATGIEVLRVCEYDRSRLGALEAGVERGRVLAEATNFARDLVNAPANHMTPTLLAQAALAMSAETGLECTVLERADMERLGMGCLLGVAQGSCQPPKLVVLRYRGAGDGPLLALAGKGITFDSGGVSLKSAEGMQNMKDDMAGAAAVLGAMGAIARLRPALDVLAVVPATENLPSGSALKPGDVVRAMNGKTVEVISTDAEGRLILADAVAYAAEQGADFIVDVATLTGACGVALGPFYSGVVSSDGQLASWIQQAADQSGERFWRLPADDDYRELYRSEVADLKNTGGRQGGAIVGGMFVGEFAGGVPWAHLDIAPTCLVDKVGPYQPKGATGVAVRTLAELAAVIAGWSR